MVIIEEVTGSWAHDTVWQPCNDTCIFGVIQVKCSLSQNYFLIALTYPVRFALKEKFDRNQPYLVFRSWNIRENLLREFLRNNRTRGLYFMSRMRSSRPCRRNKYFFK